MKSFVYHTQINVTNPKKSFPFYKDLLTYLGYIIIEEGDWGMGAKNKAYPEHSDIWVIATEKKHKKTPYHRKGPGVNHIAFGVLKRADVDKFTKEFLVPHKIKTLYDSPKAYPQYEKSYYGVFFEDPDRLKLEVVSLKMFERKTK